MGDWKEYPHETALRLKRNAAPDLYAAGLPFERALNRAVESFGKAQETLGGPITDQDGVIVTVGELRAMSAALAKARGEQGQ